jgi:hypothetical protein
MDMTRSPDVRQQFDQLVNELEKIRRHGIKNIDGGPGTKRLGEGEYSKDNDNIPAVAFLANEFARSEGNEDLERKNRIELLLREAAQGLQAGGIGQKLNTYDLTQTELKQRAQVLFGLLPNGGIDSRSPKQITGDFRQNHKGFYPNNGNGSKRFQRHNLAVRQHLADSLCGIFEPSANNFEAEESGQASSVEQYIPRPELRQRFDELVNADAKLIVIHGLPGMGKTWLARGLLDERRGEGQHIPFISVINGLISTPELQAALIACGIETKQPISGDPREYLAMLLCSEKAPHFTILDGLNSADELFELVPRDTSHVVLATCRDRGAAPPEHCHFIAVSEMTEAEGIAIVRMRLPSLNEKEALQLTSSLDHYPLAIRYACALIERQHLSIQDFVRDFQTEPKETVGQSITGDRVKLRKILLRIALAVYKTDPMAFGLLKLISACRTLPAIDRDILWRYVSIRENRARPVRQTRFAQALEVLQRFSLVESRVIFDEYPAADIVMHSVTKRLLRESIIGDRLPHIAKGFVSVYFSVHSDINIGEVPPVISTDRVGMTMQYTMILIQGAALCGDVIIEENPPGGMEQFDPPIRSVMEKFLVNSLYQTKNLPGVGGNFPNHWYEWAEAYTARVKSQSSGLDEERD